MISTTRLALALASLAVARASVVCSLAGVCVDRALVQSSHVDNNVLHTKQKPTTKPNQNTKGEISTAATISWLGVVLGLLVVAAVLVRNSKDWEGEEALADKYLAEFVGTYMLVFSVGCNHVIDDKTWGVTSIACTLMVSIYALAGVSGANFNPAVSVAMGLCERLPWVQVVIYICVQLAAGIFGGLSYGLVLEETFNLAPTKGHRWWQAGLAELLYTFMLAFVVLNTTGLKKQPKNEFFGLAIGFSIVAGGYGAGGVSMGCFNPAVALGIDSSSSALGPGWFAVYFVFEMLGASAAAALFRVCRSEEFDLTDDGVMETVGQSPAEDAARPKSAAQLVSEFLGTYMLVLTIGLNVLNSSKAGAFSIAASLTCMVFALGSCSGAYFNPAVTIAVWCSGRQKLSASNAAYYMGMQFLGGALAAFTYMLVMDGKTVPLAPAAGASTRALVGELVFTFLLSFVVLSVATVDNALSEYFGLAIGACVIVGGYAIGSLSGGLLNPAAAFGLAISDCMNGGPIEHFFSYAVMQMLGGALAALVFYSTHAKEYTPAARCP